VQWIALGVLWHPGGNVTRSTTTGISMTWFDRIVQTPLQREQETPPTISTDLHNRHSVDGEGPT